MPHTHGDAELDCSNENSSLVHSAESQCYEDFHLPLEVARLLS